VRLTSFSDYAMRLQMFAGAQDRQIKIEEAAVVFDISRNHLIVLSHSLMVQSYLPNGGMRYGADSSRQRHNDKGSLSYSPLAGQIPG
jgi:hypothetical protein